jgi:coenzyme F420-reducing hydrogenase beta subunit
MKEKNSQTTRQDGIIEAYQGYHIDKNTLLKSASGGLATAISEKIIQSGGLVYGVVYSSNFKSAHYSCAKTLEELEPLQSSKYIKAHLTYKGISVFQEVKENLEKGITVLFIGLPCTVMGLSNFLESKYDNLILIDLLCYGPTEDEVAKQFVYNLERKNKSKVKKFNVRYKKRGWTPAFLHVEFKNGKIHEEDFFKSEYGRAFAVYPKLACTKCIAKGNNHKSDITIGDYWGIEESDEYYNKNGVSIAFTRTQKGKDTLTNLDNFVLNPADIDFAISNNKIINEQKKVDLIKREKFKRMLEKDGLRYAVRETFRVQL